MVHLPATKSAGPSSSHSSWAILLSAAAATTLLGTYYITASSKSRQHNNDQPTYPPLCSAGLLETVDAFANGIGIRDFVLKHTIQDHQKFLRLNLWVPGVPMVVLVAEPEDSRAILKDSTTIKPTALYQVANNFSSGVSILTLSGHADSWFHRRKGMNPAFAPKRIKIMQAVSKDVFEAWIMERLAQEQDEISFDVGREMVQISIAIICRSALDYIIAKGESDDLVNEINLAWTEFTMKDGFNPFRRFFTWALPERQRAFLAARRLKEFAFRVMENYKKNPSPEPHTMIDLIMKNSNYNNDQERASDIIIVLFAGHDTTGYSMALTLRELAKHPDEQTKLRTWLVSEPLASASTTTNSTVPSSNNNYLKAVIDEIMRLHPIVTFSGFRQLGRDYVTRDGKYVIPKNSVVCPSQTAVFQDEALFSNPQDFEPSRWIDNVNVSAMKQAFFPFSLGSRNCIGQPLANAEMETMLTLLLPQFEFSIQQQGLLSLPGATLQLRNCILTARRM